RTWSGRCRARALPGRGSRPPTCARRRASPCAAGWWWHGAGETKCRPRRGGLCEHEDRTCTGCQDVLMARNFTLHSDLGDKLLFASMDATERLGELFRFRLEMLGKDAQVDLRRLLGTSMAVQVHMPDGYK